ncbi:MAG TPA: histidine phosphatase family protein [Clostridia bacterium]|nr:histidine phosphatase family protein [Clostridia bacterium]
MLLFLIRHARSETLKNHWQTPNSKLGKLGKQQAKILSQRSRFSKLDTIFTSKWERSRKTAEILSDNLKIETETLDYIHEREQLPQMYGAARESRISKDYVKEYYANYGNLDWKFKNKEESVRDVLTRAKKLSNFLRKNYKGKRIMVVSHDVFIRCFISMVMLGDNYSDKTMARAISSLTINHTGISLLTHSSQKKSWKVNYINDYSHFKLLRT